MRPYDTDNSIIKTIWQFILYRMKGCDFSKWACRESSLEPILGKDLHLEVISADYKNPDTVFCIRQKIEAHLVRKHSADLGLEVPIELINIYSALSRAKLSGMPEEGPEEIDDQYQLLPVLNEPEIEKVEREYGITLPQDYRWFLVAVGAGVVWPEGGIDDFRDLMPPDGLFRGYLPVHSCDGGAYVINLEKKEFGQVWYKCDVRVSYRFKEPSFSSWCADWLERNLLHNLNAGDS